MERAILRLDLLRLCHRHDREPSQVIEAAKKYEAYLVEGETKGAQVETAASEKKGPGRPKKVVDNSGISDGAN